MENTRNLLVVFEAKNVREVKHTSLADRVGEINRKNKRLKKQQKF